MANKKKKNQDTSPLALGRQQKGSAANKKANKTGSSNGSQSSSSSKTVSRVNNRSSKSTFMGGTSGYTSRTSSSSSSSSSRRSSNTSGSSSTTRRAMTTQDRQTQRSYGTTKPNVTTQKKTPATSKEIRQQQNRDANLNLKQTQAQSARDRLEADRIRRKQESEARRSINTGINTTRNIATATSRQMMEQRQEEERKRRTDRANTFLNEKQRQKEASKAFNKEIAKQAKTDIKSAVKETKASMNDYGERITKEDDRKARQAQKSGISTRNQALGIKESALGRSATHQTVEGTLKQVAGGHLKALGDDSNEYSEFKDILDHNLANGKITKAQYDEALRRWERSSTKAAKYKGWEKSKQHETFQKIFNKGEQLYNAGTKQVTDAQKGASQLKKAYLGAVSSGVGMATDFAAGPAWFASMLSRTYGGEIGNAEREGATRLEDRRYAGLQALKEVGTEAMFTAIGLPASLVKGKGLLDALARRATSGVMESGVKSALRRYIAGVTEENLEEVAGWALDPAIKNLAYGNALWERESRSSTRSEGDDLRQTVASMDKNQVRALASHLNSSDYLNEIASEMMKNGASKQEAMQMASVMQSYFNAILSNNKDAEKYYEDQMVALLKGENPYKAKLSWKELGETLASTTLLTAVTGIGGSISTATMGNAIKEQNGLDYVKGLADKIKLYDLDNSVKGQAVSDHIASGRDVAGTEVSDIASKFEKVQYEARERKDAKEQMAQRLMARQDLRVQPKIMNPDGSYTLGRVTDRAYDEYVDEALDYIEKSGMPVSFDEALDIADAYGAYMTGVIEENQMAVINTDNAAARTVFNDLADINLDNYIVKDIRGRVDVPRTNINTENMLYAKAAEHYVGYARLEQAQWNGEARKEMSDRITSDIGGNGDIAVQNALETVDPRDKGLFVLTGEASKRVYEEARYTTSDWNDIKAIIKDRYPGVNQKALEQVFIAAKNDKNIAETEYYGKQVTSGDDIAKSSIANAPQAVVAGKFIDNRTNREGSTLAEESLLKNIAQAFGINVEVVDDLSSVRKDSEGNDVLDAQGNPVYRQDNGMFIPATNTLVVNANSNTTRTITQTVTHELTHHIAVNAPAEYLKLSRYIMDAWSRQDPEGFKSAIKARQDLYETQKNQKLTPEQALEEIIADGSADFDWADPQFVEDVCTNEPTLADSIINAIKEILRKIRNMLASGDVIDEKSRAALYDKAIEFDAVQKLWMDAAQAAKKDRADQAINDWQDAVYAESEARHSLGYHAGDLGKSTVDDYARQGYGRGTGHFGFGTYFVGNEDKINFGDYGKRKHETVDFDKYNLFKPRNFEQGLKLHDALKLIDGYITQYSEFADIDRFSDEGSERHYNNTVGINRAAENLVDEYEWNDFQWDESTQKYRDRVDEYIADSLDDYDRNEIKNKAQEEYDKAQNQSIDEDAVRKELADRYDTFKGMTDFWGNPFVSEASEEEYIENHLQETIDIRNSNKDVPYDYYYYKAAQEAIKSNSENWEWKEGKLGRLAENLRFALGFKHSENEIRDALKETERIVNDYAYNGSRMNAERGLDSGATVFMKQLGYEGVDVRDINEMDNTEYGSVIYDLKDEDLARKQEIGTARFSISDEQRKEIKADGVDITESGSAVRYSFASWSDTDKEDLLEKLVSAGFDRAAAEKWIDDVNSISAIIFGDMARLNYEADSFQDALKPNSEYFYTLDLSTLCQKRRLYQGNYNAIMKHLVNKALHPEDTVRLREMMEEMGLETPCGICYEESRKKNEGKFAETWLNGETDSQWRTREKAYQKNIEKYHQKLEEYNALENKGKKKAPNEPKKPERWMGYKNMEHEDPYIPTLADVTTTDGRAELRKNHPEALEAYLEYQKGRGSANPKVSFTHTDYRRDILRMTKTDVANVKHIGGLRMQSFSDFESIHVIDVMQAIMDMATLKLTSQAYTKVPAFADIFGGTGVKINLSLIQKMDENGNPVYEEYTDKDGTKKKRLVFDSKEGIDPEEAFRIRNKYSKNVGTILVGVNDKQILDAWADDRVDMVIPFHRSGWSIKEFERLGLKGYEDYQDYQSEKILDPKTGEWLSFADAKKKGLTFPDGTLEELYSVDYWDSSKTGKENAEEYLRLCAEQHRRPVFYNFLHDNGDGTWSMPTEEVDGYTADGYWKSLIDYKMYDNEGVFAPQEEVKPVFDMKAAEKTLSEYEGDADTLPVNTDLVEAYLKDYKKRHPRAKIDFDGDVRLSIAVDMDEPYMSAVNSGNMEEAQRLVDEAAKSAGYGLHIYHGTVNKPFTKFKEPAKNRHTYKTGSGFIYGTPNYDYAEVYSVQGEPFSSNYKEGFVMEGYMKLHNPLDVGVIDGSLFTHVSREEVSSYEEYLDANTLQFSDSEMIDKRATESFKRIAKLVGMKPSELVQNFGEDVFNNVTKGASSVWDYVNQPGYAELVEKLGYDGIKMEEWGEDAYGVINPNQVKSADTITYESNGEIVPLSKRFNPESDYLRYSLPTTDADGTVLSDGQMEFFKNSQARDEQGRLVPVYHTTDNGGFTVFDPYYSEDGRSIFFTDSIAVSKTYGTKDLRTTFECYLNFENPMIVDADYNAWDRIPITRQVENISLTEDYDTNEVSRIAFEAGYDGVIIRNCRDWAVDDSSEFDTTENSPYSTIFIAFSSNQVKDTRNLDPTENPDIRYSIVDDEEAKSRIAYEDAMDNSYEALERYEQLIDNVDPETYHIKPFKEEDVAKFYAALKADEAVPSDDPVLEEDRVRIARSKDDFYNSLNAKWQDRWTTGGEVLDIKSVKTDIRNLVIGVMNNSDTPNKYRNEIVKKTLMDARTAFQLMKQDRSDIASYLLYHSAQRMIDNVEFYVDDTFNMYKDLKHYLSTTRISLGEEYWSDVDYNAFRRRNFGRLKLVKGETNVDEIYQELQERYPEWFDEDETMTPPDQLLQIEHVLDSIQPYKEAYSSEAAAELCFDIADELYDIMAGGKEVRSLADQYKERYDAKTKAMKQRHAEAMLRMRKARAEGVQAERAKWRAREEKRKEKAAHSMYFDRIKRNYDKLTDRLLSNTKDKHIPEQYKKELAGLLAAFDFQTVRSKEIEAKRGYKAQKTIKLEAMRTALERIENKSQLFHINDSITDIIKDLLGLNEDGTQNDKSIEGKTLDELSATELAKIDKLLRSLLHEFNNYESVRVGTKRQQAADIGHAQNNISLEHAEALGAGTDYQTAVLQGIDRILNLDMMTPAYLFRRIDPNNEGLGLMWREIRRSFDKYVRNTEQLNEWIEEIVGDYHEKGILWNKYGSGELSKWRSTNYARTFNLTNGTISLTPAQMMSVHCLAKRGQAYDHMVGAGVVVAPVSFQAKIMSDVKQKVNKSLATILTDADIKTIEAQLTPEQIKVADQLQELMATKMAAWGNEASMNVIGINLFEDPNYFPIRSDRAGLTKDLDPNQFEQAIRNFGFTKAVQPGARNAIMIDDIFDVVTEHCNNMNLYNSYTEAMNDFMKVYNYSEFRDEGETSVEQALRHAFSDKTPMFIMQFLRDLNGNVSGRASGIESMYNALLANAKKASVFANARVAAQQPTAISRAFYVIDAKYMKGISITPGAMKEMFEHCPIALWKSWGYYDINMGKSIEDVIMNNGKWLEDKATDLYGALDNVTWTAIWQMVKAEMKDTHPDVKAGTDEYWELCNERMSEIVDLTQVVDSPMHRSHAMRAKDIVHKTATAFMAEPTLTYNMLRDGVIRTQEAAKRGKLKLASQILTRVISVYLLQSVMVAGMQSIVDALRGKNPNGDDDEDETLLHLFWVNFLENWKDELNPAGKIYFVKDIKSMFDGWENRNLALQGVYYLSLGLRQLQGDPYARSSKSWYENVAYGFGYLTGIPSKTMMTGISNAMRMAGIESPALQSYAEYLDGIAKEKDDSEVVDTSSTIGKLFALVDGDTTLLKKSAGKTDEQKGSDKEEPADKETDAKAKAESDKEELKELEKKAKKKAEGLSGDELDEALWDVLGKGYTKKLDEADMDYIEHLELIYMNCGGDTEKFRAKIKDRIDSSYKKTLTDDMTQEDIDSQFRMRMYMEDYLGYTDEEISDIAYHTYARSDLQAAMRMGNQRYIEEESIRLIRAGMNEADFEKAYKNRNRGRKTYHGKYTDEKYLKSTGTYIWPTSGPITSEFGYRNAPTSGASTNHPAIDIGAAYGSPVSAADGGTVIAVGWAGGYGNQVAVQSDDGKTIMYYSHLSGWNVHEGDRVTQGQQIAQVGSTGNSTGPHLDFKIEVNGEPVNPMDYLSQDNVEYALDA